MAELFYYVNFGGGDFSEDVDWDIGLSDAAEVAYNKAVRLHLPFEDFPELMSALEEAREEIEEEELEMAEEREDECYLEPLGKVEMDADEINELVWDREEYALEYFGLKDASDEEIEEFDANELDELPLVCDFDPDFEPQNPFEDLWTLEVKFKEAPEEETIDEEEARKTIAELFDEANGDFEVLKDYVDRCQDLVMFDDFKLSDIADEIAKEKGIEGWK